MKTVIKNLVAVMLVVLAGSVLADYANDRAEIENLSNKYMVAVDAGDIDTVMSTWAGDGRLEWIFGIENGKDEIYKAMSNFGGARYEEVADDATSRLRTRHQIINHVIDVDGDKAITTAYWFAMTNRYPEEELRLMFFGHYADELERINGEWKFKVRKVYNENRDNKLLWYPELGEIDPRTRKPPE
ncbi:MAG: nuclear transport factor 2 family protein [Pseudomonadales bacterium]|nr:nuclear transport factor 2 family protein [Pseudomonadales bacterium]